MTTITEIDYKAVCDILKYEHSMDADNFSLGWHWHDVALPTYYLTKLVIKKLVKISFKSNKDTRYVLTDEGRALAESGIIESVSPPSPVESSPPKPAISFNEMFSDIVGYDDLKELLRESLQLDDPIHVLLHAPPSLAKTMFLWDIERAFGAQTMSLLGSATSHAGLWDIVAETQPRILLVDEIDKMPLVDLASLLSLMETGRLIRVKVGRKLDIKLKVWVIGAANRVNRLPPELMSRFTTFQLTEYTAVEYREVVTNVLESREGVGHNEAAEIATRLVGKTHDVRDAVRVARLSKRVGVRRAVELLIR